MEEKNKLGTALVHKACPICGKKNEEASEIIMNTILTEEKAKTVENYHNKIVGYSEKPCKQCQEYMKIGIAVIGIDVDKTEEMSNPYRSGHFSVIKEEVFKGSDIDLSQRAIFIDYREGLEYGFFKNTIDESNK